MTREEAIECLNYQNEKFFGGQSEALKMAIMALSEELSEDGTLTVHVSDGSKVSRVFVKGDNIFGGLYYPDSAENKGEPKRGHWIATPECDTCSECHFIVVAGFNFCPHCGADMRGE